MLLKSNSVLAIIIAIITGYGSAYASSPDLKVILHGDCKKLIIDGDDRTDQCSDKLTQNMWGDGRVEFNTTSKSSDELSVTLIGIDSGKIEEDNQVDKLNEIVVNSKSATSVVKKITGSCLYKNLYVGVRTVTCKATDNLSKPYEFEFWTNGEHPEFIKMK